MNPADQRQSTGTENHRAGSDASESATHRNPQRIPTLDGIRGLAVLGVVMFHAWIPGSNTQRAVETWVSKSMQSSWLAVDLFFVLSGFLITGILLRTRNQLHYFRNFYARRTLRIFPLYYLSLILFICILPAYYPQMESLRKDAWWLATYTFNYRVATQGWPELSLLSHYWSLSIEEQYYLLWPLFVYCSGRHRNLAIICAAGAVGTVGLRLWLLKTDWPWYAVYTITPSRLDGLLLGSLGAVLVHAGVSARVLRAVSITGGFVSGMLLLRLFLRHHGFQLSSDRSQIVVVTLANLHFACWVVGMATSTGRSLTSRIIASAPLRMLGTWS